MNLIKKELKEFKILLKNVPSLVLVLLVMTLFCMNFLANKSLNIPISIMALDGGIILSWLIFLLMDMLTKYFGPKAANELSIFAIIINLFFCFIFFLVSLIPGAWSASFVDGSENIINNAFDSTIAGTWYVVFGSVIAFILSTFINNFLNSLIGKLFKKNKDTFLEYILRSYISTMIAQFIDNFVFALLVSYVFFSWTITQCIICALTGMIVELLFEIIFSYFGYRIVHKWQKDKVGQEYFAYKKGEF